MPIPSAPTEAEWQLTRALGLVADHPRLLRARKPEARANLRRLRDKLKKQRRRGSITASELQQGIEAGKRDLARELEMIAGDLQQWLKTARLFADRHVFLDVSDDPNIAALALDEVRWAKACFEWMAPNQVAARKSATPEPDQRPDPARLKTDKVRGSGDEDEGFSHSRLSPLMRPEFNWAGYENPDCLPLISEKEANGKGEDEARNRPDILVARKRPRDPDDGSLRYDGYWRCEYAPGQPGECRTVGRQGGRPVQIRVADGYRLAPVDTKVKEAWAEFLPIWKASVKMTALGENPSNYETHLADIKQQLENEHAPDERTEAPMVDDDGRRQSVPD